MEEESIPNRGISHASPGYAASHITSSTRKRFENSIGITKTALEKGQKTTTVLPSPKWEENTPNAARNQLKGVRKVTAFPLFSRKANHTTRRSTTTGTRISRPVPSGRPVPGGSIMQRARTPYGHYCSPARVSAVQPTASARNIIQS
jgi:hypothetical protein